MLEAENISRIAKARRQEALARHNADLGLCANYELLPDDDTATAKARRDAVLAGVLALGCALMLLVAGLMVIDQEAYSGRTKYGRQIDLVGRQAIGMGLLLISFASIFAGLGIKAFKKGAATFFAAIGLLGLCAALGIMLFR